MSAPGAAFLLEPDAAAIEHYASARGWLETGECAVGAEIAGEGNMNRTVRLRTDRRSLILKQSRPYVVKYPDIPAPEARLLVEARFYEACSHDPELAGRMPALLALDRENHVALIEDLGSAADLTSLYAPGARIAEEDLRALCRYAARLHQLELDPALRSELRNSAMRALNHEHIFALPLDPGNGLDLDARTKGLGALATELRGDTAYVERIDQLGRRYLADDPLGALLHGDFYPGSFLATANGVRVIDPEFAFPGPPEFDLGVLAAHLLFAGEPPSTLDRVEALYARPLDRALLEGFAGAELMRRLLGVAQLPLGEGADLARKREWLELSRRWVGASTRGEDT